MSLDAFAVSAPEAAAELAERMGRKLRAGMMPPAGVPRPSEDDLEALAAKVVDVVARNQADRAERRKRNERIAALRDPAAAKKQQECPDAREGS